MIASSDKVECAGIDRETFEELLNCNGGTFGYLSLPGFHGRACLDGEPPHRTSVLEAVAVQVRAEICHPVGLLEDGYEEVDGGMVDLAATGRGAAD